MSDAELERLREQCERGLEVAVAAGADEAEVVAAYATGGSIAFEKNDLNIAISDDETNFGVRVIKDGAVGFATSNDPKTLTDTVNDALIIAGASIADPFNRLASPRDIDAVAGLYDERVAATDVAEITEMGADTLLRARERDARISIDSGGVSAASSCRAIRSTTGVVAAERSSSLSCNLFGMAVDGDSVGSFVVDSQAQRGREGFEALLERCADRFVDKAVGALHPGAGESYRGVVLFTPEAAASLLFGNLLDMMGPSGIRKGKSPLGGKLGETIASPLLTIVDDGTVDGAIGSSSFDREGLPHQPTTLVGGGVFENILYNHYEALAAGHEAGSTGHATGGSGSLPLVGGSRLVVAAGDTTLDDILRDAGRVVIVTRFSGSNDGVTGDFSGVVKAGFLHEAGEKRPISETLISGNLLDVYRDIVAVSEESELLQGRHRVPYVLADGISVTAG